MGLLRHVALSSLLAWEAAAAVADCHASHDFGSVQNYTAEWQGSPLTVMHPAAAPRASKLPLLAFMHGSTGQWEMYRENLAHYVRTGFVVVFPYVKSPEKDKSPFTTNTDGTYLLRGVDYVRTQTANSSSPLFGLVDMDSVVLAGHSMGATCAIRGAYRLAATGKLRETGVRAVITQHPGICGPFGPPPLPSTWKAEELRMVAKEVPVLFTTATNDGAFWPAPETAKHELGCFKMALDTPEVEGADDFAGAAFAQFAEGPCDEDRARQPFPDGGHNCPLKVDGPESRWVLAALRLYGQLHGSRASRCYDVLWGEDSDSLRNASEVEIAQVLPPKEKATPMIV